MIYANYDWAYRCVGPCEQCDREDLHCLGRVVAAYKSDAECGDGWFRTEYEAIEFYRKNGQTE